jgi:hypothetical protein
MRPDDLRKLLRQQPFRPFRLYVLESTVYEIRHRDFAQVTRSTVTIYFPNSNDADPLAERLLSSPSCISQSWSRLPLACERRYPP